MRTIAQLPCIILLLAAGSVHAAEISPPDTQAIDFAVNYCGVLVGQDPSKLANAVRKFPGATLQAARPLSAAPPAAVEPLVNALNAEDSTPVHRVTFKSLSAGVRVVAYVTTGLEGCLTTVTGSSNAFDLVSDRLRKPDSGWKEINGPAAGQRVWQQTNSNDVVVTFTASTDGRTSSMAVTNHIDMLMPTLAAFDAFADAVIGPCMKIASSTAKPDPRVFASHFTAEPKAADGSIKLMSKVNIPGGQLLLTPVPTGTSCVLGVYDTGFPHDYYLRALGDAYLRLPAASKKSARMSSRVEETEGMLLVTIEREK
ncbi:MAG TPA: hypothetical protein VFS58_03360 [Steroidobacteraceae bacterium]|nr:hypothetical protein [Steroidobacteraceae bacterium]